MFCICLGYVGLFSFGSVVVVLVGVGLYFDLGRVRGTLGRDWGSRLWLLVLCVIRVLVGYRNLV